MAVDTCMTPKIQDDEDDDEPIVFRRTKTKPKQNQENSEIKKVSSLRHDGSSQRHEGSSQRHEGFSQRHEGFPQKNDGSSQRRDGSSQRRDGSSQRQDGSSQRRDGSSQRRDGSSQRQDGSSHTRDGSSQRHDGSSQRRNGSSQKQCGPSERPSPGKASPNGQNSTLQKGKVVPSSKSAPLKSPLANPKASTSIPEKPKQPPTQNARINNNEKKHLNKPPAKPDVDSEDSDDDKPLSARLMVSTSTSQKSNSHNVVKVHSSHLPSSSMPDKAAISSKKSAEDSEDEGPLFSTIKMKSGGAPSVKKEIEEKPLASKAKQNGSIKINSPNVLNKRPLGDSSTPTQSSDKKPKLSESSVSAKAKQVSVKAEVKTEEDDDDDDDDDVPIAERHDGSSQRQDGSSQTRDGFSQRCNSSSQKQCGPSERPSSGKTSPNGQNSTLQKGKVVPSSKSAPLKSPLANPKASTSIPEKPKQPPTQNARINNNEKKPLNKPPAKPDVDSEDSDDDKPLSARLMVSTSTSQKSNSHNVAKVHSSHLPSSSMSEKAAISSKKSAEDSEDEGPLFSTIKMESGGEPSVKKEIEEKPLVSKAKQNGSIKINSPNVLNKRPLGDSSTPTQSSDKKPKLSESSVSAKAKQVSVKAEVKTEDDDDDDDDVPIAERLKKAAVSSGTSQPKKKTITKVVSSSLKTSKKSKKIIKKSQYSKSIKLQPSSGDGKKWTTLEHNGVIFPPDYKPHGVKMLYNGQPVDLTPAQEEVATMFAVMKDTDYAMKEKFVENFMNDWRGVLGRNHIIKKFELCDFTPIYDWHQSEKEKNKQMSTEEKKALKEEKLKQEEKYMWAVVDGVKEKVGNFRVEPPGLFRGRGEHPKMGKLKRRIQPSDITINIGKGVPIPECPIPGQSWKEVKHDNTVTWLAFWIDPINSKEFKYVFLAASSSLKGQSDKEKYEKARLLKDYIHGIRANYTEDFTNKDLAKRQIAVATYLIDKLALRAGNEKDDDEADTVGCCTLKVENVILVPPNKLEFDFLGKDSIRYQNTVDVELPAYKAIGQFKNGKKDGEDLFDKLDTSKLNAHLKELMPGLTAKVFRTYNASITLDDQLQKNTRDGDVGVKVVVYNLANKEVAIICNHQRTESKSHTAQMERLKAKMQELRNAVGVLKKDLERAKKGKPPLKEIDGDGKEIEKRNLAPDALQRKINSTHAKIEKMERDTSTKEELKTIALGTSKINYLDPRISVAWCKRHEVPIEKIFNKSLLAKFAWAMDVDPSFRF